MLSAGGMPARVHCVADEWQAEALLQAPLDPTLLPIGVLRAPQREQHVIRLEVLDRIGDDRQDAAAVVRSPWRGRRRTACGRAPCRGARPQGGGRDPHRRQARRAAPGGGRDHVDLSGQAEERPRLGKSCTSATAASATNSRRRIGLPKQSSPARQVGMGRTLGRGPRVVVTAVEHVARREVSCCRPQVVDTEPGVAAATQHDRGPLGPCSKQNSRA